MCGTNVADCIGHAAFESQRHARKWMPQCFSTLALLTFSVGTEFVFEKLSDIREDRTRNHNVEVNWQRSSHEFLHGLRALPGNVHHATLVLHECDRAVRNEEGEW